MPDREGHLFELSQGVLHKSTRRLSRGSGLWSFYGTGSPPNFCSVGRVFLSSPLYTMPNGHEAHTNILTAVSKPL